MDPLPLVNDLIADGRRLTERYAADGGKLRAAFWGRRSDPGDWELYLVVDGVGLSASSDTYQGVSESARGMRFAALNPLMVRVIGPNHPAAVAVRAAPPPNGAAGGWLLGNFGLDAAGIDMAYVYPPHLFDGSPGNPMTTDDVGQELVRRMNRRPGPGQPSRVTLRDGTGFTGVPFALQYDPQRTVVVQFIADGESAPRVVPLDDIASIA